MAHRRRFVLGSSSPRRIELLMQAGLAPDDVRPPDIDEAPHHGELPQAYCSRIAREKNEAVSATEDEVVLCADTTVAVGRRILGKPTDADEAAGFLRLLSGRRHQVITAFAIRDHNRLVCRKAAAVVRMRPLDASEIDAYLVSGEWHGKAGGYAIQGAAGSFIPWIRGSYSAIVGLPISETVTALKSFGIEPWSRS